MKPVPPTLAVWRQTPGPGAPWAAARPCSETEAQLRANLQESLLWEPEANELRTVVQRERGVVTRVFKGSGDRSAGSPAA